MADPASAETVDSLAWQYINDWRLVTMFLGAAMVVLGIGMLIVLTYGADEVDTADLFLGLGIFLLLFAVLLFLPRMRTRGAISFSLIVGHPMDVVEDVVRGAVEESGRKVQVEFLKARLERPPRMVHVEGVAWRFSLRDAPYRQRRGDATLWTEIIQAGLASQGDEVARDLRERVLSRLAIPRAAKG